jgi:BlaI family transcriptional regulator, penicillinase repressor
MTARSTSSGPLTALQRAVVDYVAAKGPVTSEQVRLGIHQRHPLKDSSIRTILRRLEARGLLSHTVEGKVFMYRAETSSARVAARAVKRMIDGFWAGSAERFLAGLVDEKVLSAAELERLARKVRSRK